jgi:hypothetical protein
MTNAETTSTVDKIAAWICWFAARQGTGLTSIQLVKYLYLADLYRARRSEGATITGWPWAFVHFGPYCTEAVQTLERIAATGLVEAERYYSRHSEDGEFTVYKGAVDEPAAIDSVLSIGEMSELKKVIKKWAGDTAGLLDYVYFDTEPMTGVQPRDRLDFSKAKPTVRSVSVSDAFKKLPERKKRKAQEAIAKLSDRTVVYNTRSVEGRLLDADYSKALDSDVEREKPPSVGGEFDVTKLLAIALDDDS